MKLTISVSLIIVGGLLTLMNVSIPFRFYVLSRRGKSISCIPIIGGLLLFIGLLLSSNALTRHLSFLGLILDVGCLPMVTVALYKLAKRDRAHPGIRK
jgi:hypothetical protein